MENSATPMQPEDEVSCIWKTTGTQKPDKSWDQKYWKEIFLSSCVCSLLLDPLFLYVPILKDDIKCLMLDPNLKIVILVFKSLTDFFYLIDIFIRIYRSENYSGLIVELNRRRHRIDFNFVLKSCVPRIAKAIWASYDILTDIVAVLPLPHVAILIFFSKMSDLRFLTTTTMVIMNIFALFQYVPRVLRIYLSSKELRKIHLEEIRETPIWLKGGLNFLMYIMAGHLVGALWYFFAIQRMMICWHSACRENDGCDNRMFGCPDYHFFRNTTILDDLCPVSVGDNSSDTMFFDFGIFATVLKYGVVGSTSFFKKLLNCFCWGLRNLSSFGSNLQPSVDEWENLYTFFISISGLLLFLYLIGNLQMYMQFETIRREDRKRMMLIKQKTEEKGPDIELWLFKRGVPTRLNKDIKLRFMEKVHQALEDGMKINLDNILALLPSDVQSRIKDYMPLAKLKQVPMFQGIDEDVLKIIYQKLEPVRYTENSFIIQKGKPLDKMVYIVDGFVSIEERSSDDSRRGAGEVCGEVCGQERILQPWYSEIRYSSPLATEYVKAIGVVEALALSAQDWENIREKERLRYTKMLEEETKRGLEELKCSLISERFYEKMSAFQNMDDKVLKEICGHLRLMKYNCTDNIIEKGDPIQMLFIVEGRIGQEDWVKDAGEIYGEELLVWPFSTSFPDKVPTAAESLFVITDIVEALVLTVSDMESVATKFRKHFVKNYYILVEKLSSNRFIRFFTKEEVKRATSNYTCLNYPNGGYGTVYQTELNGRAFAIKTCNSATGDPFVQSQRLVQEAFALHLIRYSDVEELFGVCSETKWPIMVYSRTNALTLVEHLHINKSKLLLKSRMKIAEETARALAHAHSILVIHRDVKTANILIDRTTYNVKVTGFGASRLLDEDEGEMEDEVSTLPGALGYVDPEYLESNVLTKKSDVYSFGVVLVELLPRQEAVSSDGPERSLANDFVRSVQEDRLGQILDGEINRDKVSFEMAKQVSELAVRCLSSGGVKRPSMEEVAGELEEVVEAIHIISG